MEEELRKQAVQRHLAGESPKAVYTSLDRSKKWFFKWLNRYQSGATDWYKEHSRAPISRPSELSIADKEILVSTRNRLDASPFAQIGVSAIKWELHKLGLPFRSDSTINRTLKREGLVKKNEIFPHRGRVPVLYRSPVLQQHPSDGSCWPPLHQRRRQILLDECD
jgi:transposase